MFRRICSHNRLVALVCTIVVLLAAVGCKDSEEDPQAQLRPSFSVSNLSVRTGETISCRILNASKVILVSVPDCVEVVTDGLKLHVTGLVAGEGELNVSADGMRLRCAVEVIGVDTPVDDDPETPEEIAARLDDASMRIAAGEHVLSYSVPGTIFSVDMRPSDNFVLTPGCVIEAIDISTGREFSVIFPDGISRQSLPAEGASPVDIPLPKFFVNSTAVGLSSAKVMKHAATEVVQHEPSAVAEIMWIRLITADNLPVWVVLCLPF